MNDGLMYLISNATITASYNSSAFDFINQGPMYAYELNFYMSNGIGTANSATVTNPTVAGNVTFIVQGGSETNFTNVSNTDILLQHTVSIAQSSATTLEAVTLPFVLKQNQEFARLIVVPGTGISLNGANANIDTGRRVAY